MKTDEFQDFGYLVCLLDLPCCLDYSFPVKNLNSFDIYRTAAAVPVIKPGAIETNVSHILELYNKASGDGADIVVFPELCITGYSTADLFRQDLIFEKTEKGLALIIEASRGKQTVCVVGLPLRYNGLIFNCAAVISDGVLLGLVPKTYIPNTGEFYENRWFSSGKSVSFSTVPFLGDDIPFGSDLIFRSSSQSLFSFGVEICEDLWAPAPPSGFLAPAGAMMIVNPSASNELVGKAEYRRGLVCQQSARCLAAYVYCSCGEGESSTDVVYGGHILIAENGKLLAKGKRFSLESQIVYSDVDLGYLQHERINSSSFRESFPDKKFRTIVFSRADYNGSESFYRSIDRNPFVPEGEQVRERRCEEIFSIQCSGLMTRLKHIGCKNVVLGLSGGLDSTLALLIVIEAFDRLNLDRKGIQCLTMPGFGTTGRTLGNVEKLCRLYRLPLETIDIREVCNLQLRDLNHSGEPEDVAYENVQARQRTSYLMNRSNMVGGIVIGTGDLSELALGWCTYNGDHMSMYAVNTGVPKTLVKYLVDYVAVHKADEDTAAVLHDIIDTPISPELLPPDKEGNIAQKTEDTVGPYELHDFFLYQFVRCGFSPRKILFLACRAYAGKYTEEIIKKWLRAFIRRFFSQQFKRSCLPDGPKVGTIALSPRGDWRMPSDASAEEFLKDLL